MGDAEGALGDGNADSAVDGQGRALDALRKGAQALAQALAELPEGLRPIRAVLAGKGTDEGDGVG